MCACSYEEIAGWYGSTSTFQKVEKNVEVDPIKEKRQVMLLTRALSEV